MKDSGTESRAKRRPGIRYRRKKVRLPGLFLMRPSVVSFRTTDTCMRIAESYTLKLRQLSDGYEMMDVTVPVSRRRRKQSQQHVNFSYVSREKDIVTLL